MRMSQAEKDKTHARILDSASRLLRERGVDGASVGDVMKDAGLTHGGFYKHFANKDALVESALDAAFATFTAMLTGDQPDAAPDAVAAYRELYLSDGHVANPGLGCPVAAIGQDIARGSEALKLAFGRGVDQIVDAISHTMDGSPQARRVAALQQFSMLVGAVVIARASDSHTADEVLAAVSAAVG